MCSLFSCVEKPYVKSYIEKSRQEEVMLWKKSCVKSWVDVKKTSCVEKSCIKSCIEKSRQGHVLSHVLWSHVLKSCIEKSCAQSWVEKSRQEEVMSYVLRSPVKKLRRSHLKKSCAEDLRITRGPSKLSGGKPTANIRLTQTNGQYFTRSWTLNTSRPGLSLE